MASLGGDAQIEEIAKAISTLSVKIGRLEDKDELTERETNDLAAWRKKEEQLRKEKEQLRKEKEQLREKELIQLRAAGGKTLQEGFPPLKYGVTESGPSIPNNHDRAKILNGDFSMLDVKAVSHISSALWRQCQFDGGRIEVSTEADVAVQVRVALQEVIQSLRLHFKVLSEVQIFRVRPDMYLVATPSGIPKGVVEVKKAGEVAMHDERIAGEVYDHMMHLRSLFGVREVFGILTSYQQWRVCWLADDNCNNLASTSTLPPLAPFETPTKTVSAKEKAENDDSPTICSPSKKVEKHGCQVEETEEIIVEESDEAVPRRLCASAVYEQKDADGGNLFRFVGSILLKMDRATMVSRDLTPGTALDGIVRVLTDKTYLWKHVTLKQGLQWSQYPRQGVKRFYVWDDLGHGIDGRALLVASQGGSVCVLKFFYPKAIDEQIEAKAQTELEWWHRVYPEYRQHVRLLRLVGRPVLMMPHFATPARTAEVVEGVRRALLERFDKHGWIHADVRWRNIGLLDGGSPMLFDLGHIISKDDDQDSSWVGLACSELLKKVS